MFENVKADLIRYCYQQPSLKNKLRAIRSAQGFQATVMYRFRRWIDATFTGSMLVFFRYPLLALHFCLNSIIANMHGIYIDHRAVIGKGLYIGHFGGIEIGPCEMGEYCCVHQHVKIGMTTLNDRDALPHIGSCVWIGAHARITGNITVGDSSTVSAGTMVINNVGPNNLVVGDPARVISTEYDNRSLLGYIPPNENCSYNHFSKQTDKS